MLGDDYATSEVVHNILRALTVKSDGLLYAVCSTIRWATPCKVLVTL